MPRRDGFTLLEICIAVSIGVMLVMLAVPSLSGLLRAQRLQRVEGQFDDLVRTAQQRAVTERRAYGLVWKKGAIELTPLERTEDEPAIDPEHIGIGKEQEFIIERTAALGKKPPGIWTFWRSGVCEPATITYHGPEGSWTAVYNPLTARRTSVTEEVL